MTMRRKRHRELRLIRNLLTKLGKVRIRRGLTTTEADPETASRIELASPPHHVIAVQHRSMLWCVAVRAVKLACVRERNRHVPRRPRPPLPWHGDLVK